MSTSSLEKMKALLGDVLHLGKRAETLTANTPLFGSLPELDSMAVIHVAVAIEERYGVRLDDEEVTAENFATVGSLIALADSKCHE